MLKLVRDKYEISASFVRDKCEIIRVYNFEITTIFNPFSIYLSEKSAKNGIHSCVCPFFFVSLHPQMKKY